MELINWNRILVWKFTFESVYHRKYTFNNCTQCKLNANKYEDFFFAIEDTAYICDIHRTFYYNNFNNLLKNYPAWYGNVYKSIQLDGLYANYFSNQSEIVFWYLFLKLVFRQSLPFSHTIMRFININSVAWTAQGTKICTDTQIIWKFIINAIASF